MNGDCYDRYLVRIEEMRQSNNIIKQCVEWLRNNPRSCDVVTIIKSRHRHRVDMKSNMEELIHHFKLFTEGFHVPELVKRMQRLSILKASSVFISYQMARTSLTGLKIRAPGYAHLQGLNEMAKGHMIADAVTIIGTQDIVFGEIDR